MHNIPIESLVRLRRYRQDPNFDLRPKTGYPGATFDFSVLQPLHITAMIFWLYGSPNRA